MIKLYQYNIRKTEVKELIEGIKPSDERVIIKTCWRFEAYDGKGYVPEEVVRHLFKVTAGLDSPVPGDGSIQNQVKQAYCSASAQYKLDKFMHKLFQTALQTGKFVRSSTSISKGAMSYAQAIFNIVDSIEETSKESHIVVVGVNNITRNLLKFLIKKGYKNLLLVNRSLVRAQQLADEFMIPYGGLDELFEIIKENSILIAALAAPESIIDGNALKDRTPLIIDIGVPSNVKLDIADTVNFKYYNIDAIERLINNTISFRKSTYEEAMNIVEQKVKEFMQWQEKTLKRDFMLQQENKVKTDYSKKILST